MATAHAQEAAIVDGTSAAMAPWQELFTQANAHLDEAQIIISDKPGTCKAEEFAVEIEGTRNMLRGSTFYLPVTNEETLGVLKAMSRQFSGTGHWYTCQNGMLTHPGIYQSQSSSNML